MKLTARDAVIASVAAVIGAGITLGPRSSSEDMGVFIYQGGSDAEVMMAAANGALWVQSQRIQRDAQRTVHGMRGARADAKTRAMQAFFKRWGVHAVPIHADALPHNKRPQFPPGSVAVFENAGLRQFGDRWQSTSKRVHEAQVDALARSYSNRIAPVTPVEPLKHPRVGRK